MFPATDIKLPQFISRLFDDDLLHTTGSFGVFVVDEHDLSIS